MGNDQTRSCLRLQLGNNDTVLDPFTSLINTHMNFHKIPDNGHISKSSLQHSTNNDAIQETTIPPIQTKLQYSTQMKRHRTGK